MSLLTQNFIKTTTVSMFDELEDNGVVINRDSKCILSGPELHLGAPGNLRTRHIQLPAVAYIRLPFYEAKVLFSEGRGRM